MKEEKQAKEGLLKEDLKNLNVKEQNLQNKEKNLKTSKRADRALTRQQQATLEQLEAWKPKTLLGKQVRAGEITENLSKAEQDNVIRIFESRNSTLVWQWDIIIDEVLAERSIL